MDGVRFGYHQDHTRWKWGQVHRKGSSHLRAGTADAKGKLVVPSCLFRADSQETEDMVKPGVHWDVLHLHAHKVLIDGFLKLGIFKGDPEAILQTGVTLSFFPHGLGHSLGLDVHDSLQYLRTTQTDSSETRSVPEKLFRYLRIRQVLEENMVLTVEPGCYFPPQLMEEHGAWKSEFVDKEKLKEYCEVGGVRIEDVVVVRDGQCENLTTVGREREWIEKMCSGA